MHINSGGSPRKFLLSQQTKRQWPQCPLDRHRLNCSEDPQCAGDKSAIGIVFASSQRLSMGEIDADQHTIEIKDHSRSQLRVGHNRSLSGVQPK
jgi:hypothetical protein